ncbi:MAG: hypothetical protein ACI9Q4_000522, partial [Sediminicola sp.]
MIVETFLKKPIIYIKTNNPKPNLHTLHLIP